MSTMSIKSLRAEALRICNSDGVHVHWPPDKDIVWLKLDSESTDGSEDGFDVSTVMSKCLELQKLKEKLLVLGRTEFNVCQSVPNTGSTIELTWPEKSHADVKKFWVTSSDTKSVIEQVIDEVREFWRDECFILHGYPLTTNSSLNALFIIGQLFAMVGLVKPVEQTGTTFCFFRYEKWTLSYERRLDQILNSLTDQNTEEAFSPGNNICSREFLKYLVTMNWIQLRDQVMDLLHNIEEADNQISPTINLTHKNAFNEDADENNNISVCNICKTKGRCLITCNKLEQKLDDVKSFLHLIDLNDSNGSQETTLLLEFSDTPMKELLEIVHKSTKSFSMAEITQFCLMQLLSCYKKLCGIFRRTLELTEDDIIHGSCLTLSSNQNILTSLIEPHWASGPLEVKVLDFGKELWMNLENHADYQSETLLRICNALEDTWRGESLELRGFPIVSEFNASLIFILGHMFDEVRFSVSSFGRNSVFFHTFRSYPRHIRDHLEKVISLVSLVHCEGVLSVVPLKFLYGGDFYDKVRSSNNATLLKRCQHILKIMFSEIDDAKCL